MPIRILLCCEASTEKALNVKTSTILEAMFMVDLFFTMLNREFNWLRVIHVILVMSLWQFEDEIEMKEKPY